MLRAWGARPLHGLLVVVGVVGLLSCKVRVDEPAWDALAPTDPGVAQDLGQTEDPGGTPDDGERPDTVLVEDPGVEHDPGGTQDPGAGQDPGTVDDTIQETFEDVPFEPCNLQFNPGCADEPCDDGDPETANDKCMGGVDSNSVPFCECVGSAIPMDACEGLTVDQCTASFIGCDDGDARTESDACAWGVGEGGLDACVCAGKPSMGSACARDLNPMCIASRCLLGGLIPGRCGQGGLLDTCTCVPEDPCGSRVNPGCVPEQCIANSTSLGVCGNVFPDGCTCKATLVEPCGSKDNPQCTSKVCVRDGKLGFGQCEPTELGCQCNAVDTRAQCGSVANPECKPATCPLADGAKGVCRQTVTGMCVCDVPPV